MWCHKTRRVFMVVAMLVMSSRHTARAADPLPPLAAPAVSEPSREFLSRVARRTMRDRLLGRPDYRPDYVPNSLESLTGEVIIRVRQGGFLRAVGGGGPAPAVIATRDAALTALQQLTSADPWDAAALDDALIEIELVGPSEPIPITAKWTEPRSLDAFIEPGVHGLTIEGMGKVRRVCPTEFYTNDVVVADVVKEVAPLVQKSGDDIANVRVSRFRTVHWYESSAGKPIISLHRGLLVIPPSAVTRDYLDDAINRLGEYMIYRQLSSGLFSYLYEPAQNRYSVEDNDVRQAGAAAAMAAYAKWAKRSAPEGAAKSAVEQLLRGLTGVPSHELGAFVAVPDQNNKLGITALTALAMAEFPNPDAYADTRAKLIHGMLWLQRPSGLFLTAFPPVVDVESQDYFPGEALLAMAAHYRLSPQADVLEAFDRAIEFYRGYFRNQPSPAFVPWQVQAYTIMAQQTKRRDYVDFVFELTDWLAPSQMNAGNCEWPELWGGVASYQIGRAGVSTAAYLEGFADALTLARTHGDRARAERYERLVRDAARFVVQLQVRPEEAYFVRSPIDAVGAIRTAPALNLLRIDHCQHALVGLIKARQVLFPESG